MTVLRSIEQKIEGLFEGVFGRAFRRHVQPVELARKLAKEMDEHRTISVSRIYVPNEYTVYLAPPDREQFATYEDSLVDELRTYLAEHARRENYALLTSPRVQLETDADLTVGEFGIATRMMQPQRRAPEPGEPESQPEIGHTMIYRPKAQATEAVSPVELGMEREHVTVSWDGQRREIDRRRFVIGRSKECDVQLADPNVSRRHAELRQEGASYWLVDLDSTNGVEINGRRLKRAKLESGDRVTIGATELVFRRELP
ncbi:MAG: DUF3662 and FHA domain-containing protein [Actinobacteria bacterium]|nr:DUF3662 and FHA domain-containing protein [Actinomycetota bacterium]